MEVFALQKKMLKRREREGDGGDWLKGEEEETETKWGGRRPTPESENKVQSEFFFLRTRNTAEELKTEVLLSDDGEPKKWFILTVDVLAGRYYIIANCRCIGIGSREEAVETSYCHFMSFDVT